MIDPILRTLFVHTVGTRLVLDGESVKALHDERPSRRLPLHALDSIVVCSGVDVSTPLLIRCAEEGRVVAFLSRYGKPRAIVEGAATGRSELRRLQYAAHADQVRRDALAADVVGGKVRAMSWCLRQWARDAGSGDANALRHTAEELDLVSVDLDVNPRTRDQVLGVEGEATRRFYRAWPHALRELKWPGRQRRPPTDPLNATLSWCYGMTRIAVQGAAFVSGLDSGTGFLHGDRPGQPSLVLDLMEELRPAVDRLAVGLWNSRKLRAEHFEQELTGAVRLTHDGREVIMEALHQFRTKEVEVSSRSSPIPQAFIPLMQAHSMANALRRGERYIAHRRRVK